MPQHPTTLRDQLADVAARWVNPYYARRMMEGDPLALVNALAAMAWLTRRAEDHDTEILRAVDAHIAEHKHLLIDTPGI
jgi:hypothetical protein